MYLLQLLFRYIQKYILIIDLSFRDDLQKLLRIVITYQIIIYIKTFWFLPGKINFVFVATSFRTFPV